MYFVKDAKYFTIQDPKAYPHDQCDQMAWIYVQYLII